MEKLTYDQVWGKIRESGLLNEGVDVQTFDFQRKGWFRYTVKAIVDSINENIDGGNVTMSIKRNDNPMDSE